ncbi:hypothetical protein ACFLSQ_10000 [Bacteroidota bacterium]
MKNLIFIMAAFVLSVSFAYSQESEKPEINSLFGSGEVELSGYGGPVVKFSSIQSETALFVGGRGGLTINKTFTVGLAGYGNVLWPTIDYNGRTLDNTADSTVNEDLMFGYGGMFVEYIYNPTEIVHFSANTLFGFGGSTIRNIDFDDADYDYDNMKKRTEPWAAYFVVEPAVAVELNVTSFFRIGLEASYRYVSEIRTNSSFDDISAQKDINLSGFAGGLTFQFGKF